MSTYLKNYLQSSFNPSLIPVPTREELRCTLNEIKCEYSNKVPHAHHDRDHIAKNLVELTRSTKDDELAISLLNTLINHPLYTDRLSSHVMKPMNNAYTHIHNFFSSHEKRKSFGTCSETIAIHELNRREETRKLNRKCNATPVLPKDCVNPAMKTTSVTPVLPNGGVTSVIPNSNIVYPNNNVTPVIPNSSVTPVLPPNNNVTPVIPNNSVTPVLPYDNTCVYPSSSITPVLPSNNTDSDDYVPVLPRMGY